MNAANTIAMMAIEFVRDVAKGAGRVASVDVGSPQWTQNFHSGGMAAEHDEHSGIAKY